MVASCKLNHSFSILGARSQCLPQKEEKKTTYWRIISQKFKFLTLRQAKLSKSFSEIFIRVIKLNSQVPIVPSGKTAQPCGDETDQHP